MRWKLTFNQITFLLFYLLHFLGVDHTHPDLKNNYVSYLISFSTAFYRLHYTF